MRLIVLHKILIGSALVLAIVMLAWGLAHWRRGESDGWMVFVVGAVALAAGSLYARRLWRNPPLK